MSLVCAESQEKILISSGLFAATRSDHPEYLPISGELLKRIPPQKKRGRRCEPDERGIDIYRATARMNGQVFLNSQFELGEFAFSIPADIAWEILPNLADRIIGKRKRKK